MTRFTPLNAHTFACHAGGLFSPAGLCERAAEKGYDAVAVADRAPLVAFPVLAHAAHARGLKPVFGMTLDVALPGGETQPASLFAIDAEGMKGLLALASLAYGRWPGAVEVVPVEALAERAGGLVLVLPACDDEGRPAPVTQEHAGDRLAALTGPFEARAYIGLPHPPDGVETAAQAATRLGLPVAAFPAVRYACAEDGTALDALRAARKHAGWEMVAAGGPGALLSSGEASELYSAWEEAVENTARIAEMCAASLLEARPEGDAGGADALARITERARAAEIPLGDAGGALPRVEAPGSRLAELLAGEEGAAYAGIALEISPAQALRGAAEALGSGEIVVRDAIASALEGGWAELEDAAGRTGATGDTARPALRLRGAPLIFEPGASAFVAGDASLPLLEGKTLRWTPWRPEEVAALYPGVLRVESTPALDALDEALRLSADDSQPAVQTGDLQQFPALSEGALAMLKKGALAGVPYISPSALKGWKGDFSHGSLAQLVARHAGAKDKARPPEGIAAWNEHTASTGGALLYTEQFAAIVKAAAGIAPGEAATLRLAMLNPKTDANGTLRAKFMAGCLASGLDAEPAAKLFNALAAAAPGLLPEGKARAWARVAAWTLQVKAEHPPAFVAAALNAAWQRGGRAGVAPIVQEAHRLGVDLLPPDVRKSGAGAALERASESGNGEPEAWAVRWGLALLPGWSFDAARRVAALRDAARQLDGFAGLAALVREARLTAAQVESLVQSGACDGFGAREALRAALLSPEATATEIEPELPLSPLDRYRRREWEERNLGPGFTSAPEMEQLRRATVENSGLHSKLITTRQIGPALEGQSVYLVGLLHDVRLLEKPESMPLPEHKHPGPMAVAQVEDLDGSVELVAFPPNYGRYKDFWVEGRATIVTGRVQKRPGGEGVYLLCEHLANFEVQAEGQDTGITVKVRGTRRAAATPAGEGAPAAEAEKPVRVGRTEPDAPPASIEPGDGREQPQTSWQALEAGDAAYFLIVTLPISSDDQSDIDRMISLKRVLEKYPGPDKVTLRIPYSPESGAVTSAQLPRGVRYSSLLEEDIRGLLGPEALALIKLPG